MKNTISLLLAGFESSSKTTPEFLNFVRTFKKEFTKELKSIGATDIQFSRGHFYITGFFTVNEQSYYFSLPDVRSMNYCLATNPDSYSSQLLYRTAKDYKDFTGGSNQYVKIQTGMTNEMKL